MSAVSASGRRPSGGRRLGAAAGAALTLQATRLLERADQADVADRQDDQRDEQGQQRPDETVRQLEIRPVDDHRALRLHTHARTHVLVRSVRSNP